LRTAAPLLPSFLARHPQIRIDARFSDRLVDVVAEGFDAAEVLRRRRQARVDELKRSGLLGAMIASLAVVFGVSSVWRRSKSAVSL
jgi:DNA-binding transcriptional LysR family regulator